MREVLSSAAETELGALFHNGKKACPLRIALDEMGHPQPATPMATDDNTASGIAFDTVKQKRSQAIDVHYFDCLTNTVPVHPLTAPAANSLTIFSVDPGEGVLLSAGNP
jgi:hypothetical protein